MTAERENAAGSENLLAAAMRRVYREQVEAAPADRDPKIAEPQPDRQPEDHANARRFADAVGALPALALDQPRVDSNLVFFDCAGTGLSADALSGALRAKGVLIGATGRHRLRAVTHLDVDAAAIDAAGEALGAVVGG